MKMKAPQNPTVVNKNPQHNKYVIQFAPELTKYIRNDGKVKTYRFGNKYEYIKVGDEVDLREYGSNKLISKAKVKGKEIVQFKDIPLNLSGHEVYETRDHMRKVFSSYYKYVGREVRDNDKFLVFTFDLIE